MLILFPSFEIPYWLIYGLRVHSVVNSLQGNCDSLRKENPLEFQ